MPVTSSYIQISDYALLEYIYAGESISTSSARPLRLFNNYSNEYQFLNNAQATSTTANVLDYSAVRLGRESTKWGYLDMDTVTPLVQIDPNLVLKDLTATTVPIIKYDRVKLHFLSGYDFPGIDGVILQLSWNEWNLNGVGGRSFSAASQVYLKSEERIQFSTSPLFVGDRLYDKYIEFMLPSLADVNFDFWNSPLATNTVGYQYTFNNVGFLQESQITARMYEINTTSTENNGNRYFITGQTFTTSFNQADLYSYISAVVQENPDNDYVEYYPTWNGQFLEDYISLLEAGGGNWVVVNQLEVNEQLGTRFVNTFSMTSLQDSNFNQPAVFRPIVRNSTLAVAFTVVYTMRLVNRGNGQEIIRRATWTSTNPKKYGMQLERINVLEGFRPVKVYNKIVKLDEENLATSVQYVGGLSPTVMTQNVYINSYYDVNFISVDSTTDLSVVLGETVYPQGENVIFINRFDNYVKFKIFTKSADKKQNVSLDLSSTGMNVKLAFIYDDTSKIFTKSADKKQNVSLDLSSTGMNVKLAFIYDDTSKIYIDPTQDMKAADPGAGEVLFRIDDSISTKLLSGKTREYYIVNKNDKGDEVLIYSGQFADQKDRKKITAQQANTKIDQLNSKITALKNAQVSLRGTAAASAISSVSTAVNLGQPSGQASVSTQPLAASQAETIAATTQAQSFTSASSASVAQVIQQAASDGDTLTSKTPKVKINIPEVPGFTQNMSANINSALSPEVVEPSKPSTKVSVQKVSSSALKTKTKK